MYDFSFSCGLRVVVPETKDQGAERHAERLPRCRSSALRIEVEVNAFLIGQSSLDLSGHVVGEHLIQGRPCLDSRGNRDTSPTYFRGQQVTGTDLASLPESDQRPSGSLYDEPR